jgi:hypothetical protein
MKSIFSGIFVLFALSFAISCTKTTTPPVTSPNPIEGLWAGTYRIDDAAYLGSFYYGFDIFADSTIIEQGGGTNGAMWTATGTWALSADSIFTATVTTTDLIQYSTIQTIRAIYHSKTGVLSNGTWSNTGTGPHPTGTFSPLKRVE